MDDERNLTTADRVVALLRHLGIARAHFAQGDDVAAERPEVAASLALLMPGRGSVPPLQALAGRGSLAVPPLVVHGDAGPLADAAPLVLAAFPGAAAAPLRDYHSVLWSDVAADRCDEVLKAMLAHLAEADRAEPLPPVRPTEEEGEVAGISYRARGSGPPLLLFPLVLARSQWEPLIPALAERYCTITLGGPHLGFVLGLEERARGGYGRMIDGLIDALSLCPGGSALEVGCGCGPLTRRLARRVGPGGRVVGVDVNGYMLREAAALARRENLAGCATFKEGDAETLPFSDNSFDAAMACTVLEEVDADRALAELARVVRPGGRIGVVVRAIDLPFWDSLSLPPEPRAKLTARPGAGVSPGGCADASLYRRFRALGLKEVALGPRLAIDRPEDDIASWRANNELMMHVAVGPDGTAELRAALARAEAEGSYLWGQTYHCAVGTKP